MPHVDVDLRPYFKGEESGHASKTLIVLHETVSYNKPGVMDIRNPAAFLDSRGYEIHGIIDAEKHSAWCFDPQAIYDHALSGEGMVNTRSVGFELVSEVPLMPSVLRYKIWKRRRQQLDKAAHWCAWLNQEFGIPLRYSDSSLSSSGITTHWDVSQRWLGSHGHWDCWPKHKGGYFPILYVINRARQIKKGGL